jgi:hypothetical protein
MKRLYEIIFESDLPEDIVESRYIKFFLTPWLSSNIQTAGFGKCLRR